MLDLLQKSRYNFNCSTKMKRGDKSEMAKVLQRKSWIINEQAV